MYRSLVAFIFQYPKTFGYKIDQRDIDVDRDVWLYYLTRYKLDNKKRVGVARGK